MSEGAAEKKTREGMISVKESFTAWRKNPKYVAAYNGLEEEFSRAAAAAKQASLQLHVTTGPA
jgi:hypothetical protein